MTKVIMELSHWLLEEFYHGNFKKARRIVKVLNKHGYDVDTDSLKALKKYKLEDCLEYYGRISNFVKERK